MTSFNSKAPLHNNTSNITFLCHSISLGAGTFGTRVYCVNIVTTFQATQARHNYSGGQGGLAYNQRVEGLPPPPPISHQKYLTS